MLTEQRKIRQKITEKEENSIKRQKTERGGRILVWPAVAVTNRRAETEKKKKRKGRQRKNE